VICSFALLVTLLFTLSLAHFPLSTFTPPFSYITLFSLFLHHSLFPSLTSLSFHFSYITLFSLFLHHSLFPFLASFIPFFFHHSLLPFPTFIFPLLPCIALEFAERGLLTKIYPVMIGDKTIEETEGEPTVCYTNYFASGCHPSACKDVVVDAVEQRTSAHLDRQVMLCTSSRTPYLLTH
jgi:hypothetical protein